MPRQYKQIHFVLGQIKYIYIYLNQKQLKLCGFPQTRVGIMLSIQTRVAKSKYLRMKSMIWIRSQTPRNWSAASPVAYTNHIVLTTTVKLGQKNWKCIAANIMAVIIGTMFQVIIINELITVMLQCIFSYLFQAGTYDLNIII